MIPPECSHQVRSLTGCTVSWTCINNSNWIFGLWSGWSASAHEQEALCSDSLRTHCIWRDTQQSGNERRHNKMWTQTAALTFTVGVSCVYRLCYLCFTPLPAPSVTKVCVGSKTMITDSFCFKKVLASCVIWTRNDMSLFSQPQWLNSSSFPEFHHFSVLVVLIMMTEDLKHCVHHTDKTHTSLPAEPQTKVHKPAMETCICKSTWSTRWSYRWKMCYISEAGAEQVSVRDPSHTQTVT